MLQHIPEVLSFNIPVRMKYKWAQMIKTLSVQILFYYKVQLQAHTVHTQFLRPNSLAIFGFKLFI